MTSTYFLATVLGWYLVITSFLLFLRRDLVMNVMKDIVSQPGLLFIVAFMTVIMGLLMVVSHNYWVMGWPVVITLLAWVALISGLIRLFCPETVHKMWRVFADNPEKLTASAVVTLLIGLFLLFKVYFF